jgi:hypothetical protein
VARNKREQELFDLLRARGLRKQAARTLSSAAGKTNGRLPKPVRSALDDLAGLSREVEDRITGKAGKRRDAAAKAARTRKRNASKRSEAAKRGARTRAKSRA